MYKMRTVFFLLIKLFVYFSTTFLQPNPFALTAARQHCSLHSSFSLPLSIFIASF